MANSKLKKMEKLEYECLKCHRQILETNMNCVQMVCTMKYWDVLNDNDVNYIMGKGQNVEKINHRFIDKLMNVGTSEDFDLFLEALEDLGHNQVHQQMTDFLKRNPKHTAAVSKSASSHRPAQPPDNQMLDILQQIRTTQLEDHNMLVEDHNMITKLQTREEELRAEVNQVSQNVQDLEEDVSEIKQVIEQLMDEDNQVSVNMEDMQEMRVALGALLDRVATLENENVSVRKNEEEDEKIKVIKSELGRLRRWMERTQQRQEAKLQTLVDDRTHSLQTRVKVLEEKVTSQSEEIRTLHRLCRRLSTRKETDDRAQETQRRPVPGFEPSVPKVKLRYPRKDSLPAIKPAPKPTTKLPAR